jgi:MFS family permease
MSRLHFALLCAAAFVVALGYGVILPIMPLLVERIAGVTDPGAVAWHTGALSSIYMVAVFAGAPLWGALSDRIGRRPVLTIGLAGYVLALIVFAYSHSVWLAYLTRFLAGAFVAAVLPVASAYVAELTTEDARPRRYAVLGGATLLGYLVGPALTGAVYRLAEAMGGGPSMVTNMVVWPLLSAAILGLVVLVAAYATSAASATSTRCPPERAYAASAARVPPTEELVLLALNFLIMLGLGTFEVALPLAGRATLDLDPARVGVLFAECSLMMLAVQGVLFFAPLLTRESSKLLLAAGFISMAAGFALLASAANFAWVTVAVALIAGGSGVLLPALVFVASLRSSGRIGVALGMLFGAGSLGQAVGSAAGAWLFADLSAATFWITGLLMMFAAFAAFARELVPAASELAAPSAELHGLKRE